MLTRTKTLIAAMAFAMAPSMAFALDCRHEEAGATADAKALLAGAKDAEKINGDAVMNFFYLHFAEDMQLREFRADANKANPPPLRPLKGLQLARTQMLEVKAMQKAVPDFAQQIVCFGASKDTVEIVRLWKGTLADKTPLAFQLLHRFTVKGHKIVGFEAEPSRTPAEAVQMRKIFEEGGVFAQVPAAAK